MKPHKFSDVDRAFPAHVLEHMPKMEDIPAKYRRHSQDAIDRLFYKMFYGGFQGNPSFHPAPDIDAGEAWRHIDCILRSFQPKHEHKEAAVKYLVSLWFTKIEDDSGVVWSIT